MADIEVIQKKKSQFVNASLQRMVDWKVFELCALLIDRDITEELCIEGRTWLQPRHLDEVIDERVNNDLCGHLPCNNGLKKGPRPGSGTRYRLEYNTKRIFEINEEALKFCCVECYQASLVYRQTLDTSVPYSRACAKELIKQQAKQQLQQATPAGSTAIGVSYANKGIDDIISLLSRGEEALESVSQPTSPLTKSNNPHRQKATSVGSDDEDDKDRQQQQMLSPPPLYSNQNLSEYGEVSNVEFAAGQPIIRPSPDTELKEQPVTKSVHGKVRFEDEAATKDGSNGDSALNAVYMPDNLFLKQGDIHQSTQPAIDPEPSQASSAASTDRPATAPKMTELLRSMEALQMKYDVPSVSKSSSGSIQFAPKRSAATNYQTLSTTVVTTKFVNDETEPSPTPTPEKPINNKPFDRPPSPDKTSSNYEQPPIPPIDDDNKLMEIMRNPTKASQNKIYSRRVRHVKEWSNPAASSVAQEEGNVPPSTTSSDKLNESTESENRDAPSVATNGDTSSLKDKAVTIPTTSYVPAPVPTTNSLSDLSHEAVQPPKSILKKSEVPKKGSYKPIPKVKAPVITMTINEKPNAAPLSAAALLSKREPGAIEGYVPMEVEHVGPYQR